MGGGGGVAHARKSSSVLTHLTNVTSAVSPKLPVELSAGLREVCNKEEGVRAFNSFTWLKRLQGHAVSAATINIDFHLTRETQAGLLSLST